MHPLTVIGLTRLWGGVRPQREEAGFWLMGGKQSCPQIPYRCEVSLPGDSQESALRSPVMKDPPKKSAWPPARVALVVILVGFIVYGFTALVG